MIKKKKKISRAVQCSLNAIEICKQRIVKFHHVINGIRNDGGRDERLDNAIEVIHSRLYQKLNDAYATLFMWGNVAPEEAQKEARKAAFQHYLKEQSAIMEYLDMELQSPGMWYSKEEEQFRKEIEEAQK